VKCCLFQKVAVHFSKVSVLVSRAEWQGLIHSGMQQILRKNSGYSKTGYHCVLVHRLVGCGSMEMHKSLNSLLVLIALSSVVCTECIVAKRYVIEQKLLLTAYRKSCMRNRLVPK